MKQIRVFALLLAVLLVMIYLTPGFGDTAGLLQVAPRAEGFARDDGTRQLEASLLTGSKDGRENPGSRLPHSPSSDGLWIEAEEESAFRITSPHSGQRAEISHSGQSYWSLYGEGDWVEYQIQIPRDQMYYIWVRYSEDSQHQPSKKGITVSLDGIALDTIRPPAHTARDQWRWYRAGWGFIRGDRHALRITRFPFTQAPALIDAIFITTDGSILSPKLASHETESSG